MKSISRKVKVAIIVFIGAICFGSYCNYIMTELPHMTWFDQMEIIELYHSKELVIGDFFTKYGEHGMLGYNVLMLINAVLFDMTTFFDVHLNTIAVTICGFISVYLFHKSWKDKSNIINYYIGIVLITVINFSFIQSSSGAMETQVRLGVLFFFICVFMIQKVIYGESSCKNLIWMSLLILLSVNVFGTLYSFAVIPFLFIFLFIRAVKMKKIDLKAYTIAGVYTFSTILYVIQYQLFKSGELSGTSGGILHSALQGILNPFETLLSLFAWNASAVFGFPVWTTKALPDLIYLIVGGILTAVTIWTIFRWYKSKMSNVTMVPIMLIGYTFIVFCLTFLGRYSMWEWFVNEWYYVHTKVGLIGVVWILLWDYANFAKFKKINLSAIILISVTIVFGNIITLQRAPAVKNYYEEKQPYLFAKSIEDLPIAENGNTPLLHNAETTMNAINIMKKYNLSVYKYHGLYDTMNEIALGIQPYGLHDDGWLEQESLITVDTGSKGEIRLEFYYPTVPNKSQKVTVSTAIDEKIIEVVEGINIVEIKAPANSIEAVNIRGDWIEEKQGGDLRDKTILLSKVESLE